MREQTLRIGILTRMLKRAEAIEENEEIVGLDFDQQTNLITLFIEEIIESKPNSPDQ